MSVEEDLIHRFLIINGWGIVEDDEDYTTYGKLNSIAISIAKDNTELVLIGDEGDFDSHPLDNPYRTYCWLIGILILNDQLVAGFKRVL